MGPGRVKTLYKSKFAANLPDFRKLQFAKALILLNLKFWRLDCNQDLIRSLTFSHSLGHERTWELAVDGHELAVIQDPKLEPRIMCCPGSELIGQFG